MGILAAKADCLGMCPWPHRSCPVSARHLCLAPAGEEKLGCDSVMKSLRAPVRLIASNAGVEGDVIIEKLLGKAFEIGYNAVRITASCLYCNCMPTVAKPTEYEGQWSMGCGARC